MQHNCPHCGFEKEADEFDALDERVMHECKCERCAISYALYFIECSVCMSDSIFAWASRPSSAALEQLSCECCAHQLHAHPELHADITF